MVDCPQTQMLRLKKKSGKAGANRARPSRCRAGIPHVKTIACLNEPGEANRRKYRASVLPRTFARATAGLTRMNRFLFVRVHRCPSAVSTASFGAEENFPAIVLACGLPDAKVGTHSTPNSICRSVRF